MAPYISPVTLCNICKFCTIQERPDRHSRQFKAISISPVTGIVFKAYEYSATQIADAFEGIISGHMEFEIKKQALERWSLLREELFEVPWRDAEFDLEDAFSVLDDFLFLRALRDRCGVQWVDKRTTGSYHKFVGWCEKAEVTNRGPTQWLCVVRPTIAQNKSVREILGTLMHEMRHAIFAFSCRCYRCSCPLNQMNGEGLSGHGPSWDKLIRSIEESANQHLLTYEPIPLSYWAEMSFEEERKYVARMLSGLYKKITQQRSESAELKRLERAKKWDEQKAMFAEIEKERTEEKVLDVIACAGDMFRGFELAKISSALEERVACPSPIIQNSEPERQVPQFVEALAKIGTGGVHHCKDGMCEMNNIYDSDDGESDQRSLEEGESD